jgi:hypothetical protein
VNLDTATYGLSSSQILTDMDVKLHLYIDQSFSIGNTALYLIHVGNQLSSLIAFFPFSFGLRHCAWFACWKQSVCCYNQWLFPFAPFAFFLYSIGLLSFMCSWAFLLVQNCEYCAAELVSTGSYTRSLSVTRISCCLRPGKMCTACIAC